MKRSFFLLAIFVFLSFSSLARAAIFNVTPNGGSDCNVASCDLQSALDTAAINGEDNVLNLSAEVFHASNGTFKYEPVVETGALTLQGDPGGGTIIDGSGVQAMVINTVGSNFQSPNPDSLSNISISNMTFQGGVGADNAGGLAITTFDANAVVDHCKFLKNTNTLSQSPSNLNFAGGGLSIYAVHLGSIAVTDNEFRTNTTSLAGGGAFLLSVGGNISVQENTFIGNTTGSFSSGGNVGGVNVFSAAGGAFVLAVQGSLLVDRNYFFENSSGDGGAGLMGLSILGTGVYTNNILDRNSALNLNPPSLFSGGGGALLITETGAITVANNTVVGNKITGGDAGGLFVFSSFTPSTAGSVDIYNNVIFNNAASGGTQCLTSCNDIFVKDAFDPSAVSSIVNVFNNDYSDIFFSCDPNVGCIPHQNVDPLTNINADPLFASAGTGDFHLLAGSPAIDTGTAFGPVNPTVDFDGNPRNQGLAPDMGALEFPKPPTENCANGLDDDKDGKVDCNDPDCSGAAACLGTSPQPGSENCTNGVDDDGDGNIDCNDPDCSGSAACRGTSSQPGSENCANNVDDDGDGLIDCNDPDCSGAVACQVTGAGTSPASVSAKGCAMTTGAESPSFLAYLMAPLVLVTRRFFKKS
jgi:hypothetical protein